ncbi:MAG: hypothetical protein HRU75_04105 [Planctomycetia bacterium]|nr:MAG: hypothetical protein HRU75_04105 [Planctomycetia bacterium]
MPDWRIAALALLLPLAVLLPAWPLAGMGIDEDDILYYLPARVFVGEALGDARIPQLNPWSGMDRPVLVDPQNAVWYPATWLFVGLPPPIAYAVALYGHFVLAFVGAYRLLRYFGRSRGAAAFGAVAFAFGGFMLAHRAHPALHAAAAWTPFVFLALERFLNRPEGTTLAVAALIVALQALSGHVQIAALTALVSLVYVVVRAVAGAPVLRVGKMRVGQWALVWLAAAGLCGVQLIPTLGHLPECTRVDRGFRDFVENSWSPASAMTWTAPMLPGQRRPNVFPEAYWGPSHQCEQLGYVGILPLLLAGGAALVRRGDSRLRPWKWAAVFAVLLALGPLGPVCPLLYFVPGSNLFRVPARAMLFVQLAACVLSATALDDLRRGLSVEGVRLRARLRGWVAHPMRMLLLLVGVPAAGVLAALPWLDQATAGAALRSITPPSLAVLVPIVVILASIIVLRRQLARNALGGGGWMLGAVLVADLAIIGWTIDVPARALREPGGYNWSVHVRSAEREAWTRAVQGEAGTGAWPRLWVVTDRINGAPGEYHRPLDKLPANAAALFGIATLTDYGPLQPRRFASEFAFKPWGESDRRDALLADTRWAAACGVEWILLCEPQLSPPTGFEQAALTPGGMRLFRAAEMPRRAWVVSPGAGGSIHVEQWAAERVVLRVNVPGDSAPAARVEPVNGRDLSEPARAGARAVVSRLALPGWSASVNGAPCEVRAEGLCLAVDFSSSDGNARIELTYQTPGLRTGAWLSLATGVVLAGLGIARRRRVTSAAHPPPARPV